MRRSVDADPSDLMDDSRIVQQRPAARVAHTLRRLATVHRGRAGEWINGRLPVGRAGGLLGVAYSVEGF